MIRMTQDLGLWCWSILELPVLISPGGTGPQDPGVKEDKLLQCVDMAVDGSA